MQTKIMFITFLISVTAVADVAIFATSTTASKSNPRTKSHSKLSTDIKFDGQLVGGKTQSPFESLTVVENEKSIDDLIDVRTQFADRSKKAKGMR